jgi:hypothetical protein
MKKLLVAAIAILIASPAFAAVQNVKVSGDIQSTFLDRSDFGLGMLTSTGQPSSLVSQTGVAEQTRVRIDADLTDNVSATVRLINETVWGLSANDIVPSGMKGVDLDLAYVTLREFLYSPLTVTVGRQEFFFGNGLIIGGGPNNSTSGNFKGLANDLSLIDANDGVKAVLDYKPLTLTMFYFKNSIYNLSGAYEADAHGDSDVYGLNANYQLGDAYNTVVEGYMFGRINGKSIDADFETVSGSTYTASGTDKNDTLFVPGLRVSTNPVKGLNIQGEAAVQMGNKPVGLVNGTNYGQETEHRDAMIAQLMGTYSLPVLEKYKPTLNASYTFVSGDKNGFANDNASTAKSAKVYSAWDPMFEAQGGGTIYNSLFNLTDMNIVALGGSISPLQDVTAAFTWSDLWAAQRFGTYNPLEMLQPDSASVTAFVPTGADKKRNLGNESDVNVNYAYTEDVSFGLSLGWYVPGDALKAFDMKKTANQAIADIAVKF